jgi:large subunit ribosomal protein L21
LRSNYFWEVMFAIVNIAGQQFKVSKDQELFVHRLEGKVGDNVEFSDVLLSSNNNSVALGGSLKVKAEILDHLKGDKVIVFKKKRRKGYQKMNGHRQYLTKIKISDIA